MNAYGLPREGSRVRLIGLRNPDLNGKIGTVSSYSRDGERVMISLADGPQGLVKVKPKQIEALEDSSVGGGHDGAHRGNPPRNRARSRSRDNRSISRGMTRQRSENGSYRGFGGSETHYSQMSSSMPRVTSNGDFRDNASHHSTASEIMETLRSADAMFDLADTSGDGVISEEEFEYYMKRHTDHDSKMIRECFALIDEDGNGDITRDEVRNAFLKKRRELKGGATPAKKKKIEEELLEVSRDADKLFDKADVDRNGALSIEEFETFMKKNTSHSSQAIHDLFMSMDVDKDGFVTREEVRKAFIAKQKRTGAKTTLGDILGLEEEDMAALEDDVYNMFFLSDFCSQSFWFAIFIWLLKLGLIIIIALDLWTTDGMFPDKSDVLPLVRTAQFLLLPVNVAVQEELITTFFLYANVKWSKEVLTLHSGASKGKYHFANLMRFLDGLAFLFINTTLLLQATQVIGAFLNFAALQFLSTVDNVALHLARDGYLTENLEEVASDVLLMRLPRNHNEKLQVLDSILLTMVYLIILAAWVLFLFVF